MTKPRVPKTRNAGTMTEAAYFGFIRSSLRRAFRFWKPITKCKNDARRPVKKGRQKWEYQCNACKGWFKGSETQVDHIIPIGTLKCYNDLPGFVERLTAEDGYQLLCKGCHQEKTNAERTKATK